ncbi:MAG: hypothetical protein MUF53_08930 [Gemmatimonadaceae bacterium]|nr:hypothetical protein [Gemmatimonadaceae bacterium]
MTASGAPGRDEPVDLDAALARYVRMDADPETVVRVESWIEADAPTRRGRVALDRAIAGDLDRRVREVPADVGLERLMQAAAATRRVEGRAPVASSNLLSRIRGWFEAPRLGMALAALVLVQSGLIGVLLEGRDPAPVEYRSAGGEAPRPSVRVSFSPDATEATVRDVLLQAGGTIVGGPTQLGEYWVVPATGDLDSLAARMRAMAGVRTAVVDPAGPPPAR